MLTVVVLNAANGLYQNSIYGFVSDFPAQFINAIVIGNNSCGILVSVLAILGIFFSSRQDVTALIYFSFSLLIVAICLLFFFVLGRLQYAQHFRMRAKRVRRQEQDDGEKAGFSWTVAWDVFKQTWKQMMSVFLTFFVTLAIFPAIVAEVKPNGEIALPEKLFTPVVVFLLFNSAATAGNILASFVQWPSPKYLIYPVAARLLFIPTFLLCNFGAPEARRFPAYITSDYVFMIFMVFFSLTQGYFSSLSMMYAPKAAEESKQRIAGMMSGFFLVLGKN
ncbi:Protein ENT-1 a [Aphelenchoides avenae]|nr:Protein ENT-1 a [Aphelenchus avenae]